MRRHARKDANHDEIVKALRQMGATVQSLAAIGDGCPDILVGFMGDNFLMEIKDGEKPPSDRKLTTDEKLWHAEWRGTVYTVLNVEQAIMVIADRSGRV